MDDAQACVLCDARCDQPGRFCTACVGQRGSGIAGGRGRLQLGRAQVVPLRLLQWPISLLLLGATGLAGMRTSALVLDLLDALRARRTHGTAADLVNLHHLAAVEQQLVLVGAALIAAVGALWLVWWSVAYANLKPLGVTTAHGRIWAVLSWLVPVADLFVPQRVADELWRGSDPWTPLGWRQARYGRRSSVVRLWWTSWCLALGSLAAAEGLLVGFVGHPALATFAVRATGAAGVDGCLIASAVCTAVAGLAAIHLVVGVTSRQGERARLMLEAGLV